MSAIDSESSLDLTRLENVRQRGNRIEARCPACFEEGRDRSGNHLLIYPDGKFGCAAHPNAHEHRQRIWALAGGSMPDGERLPPQLRPRDREDPPLEVYEWPELETGTSKDLHQLARLRGFAIEPLRLASDRGILRFFSDETNGRCWTVTDDRRHVRQDRRLDGKLFLLKSGKLTKARSLGRPQFWPIGLGAAENFPVILFHEGGPDLLAGFQLIWSEDRESEATAVCLTGTGQHIHAEALPLFQGKRVRLFPHADESPEKPGYHAAARWQRQLRQVATVDCYSFRGLTTFEGNPVGDANDFLFVDPDTWERDPEVRCSIPERDGGVL